jgi:hypothetical protein
MTGIGGEKEDRWTKRISGGNVASSTGASPDPAHAPPILARRVSLCRTADDLTVADLTAAHHV